MTPLQKEAMNILVKMTPDELTEFVQLLKDENVLNREFKSTTGILLKKMGDSMAEFWRKEESYNSFTKFMERRKNK